MRETKGDASVLKTDIRKRLKEFELNVCFTAKNRCLGILAPSGGWEEHNIKIHCGDCPAGQRENYIPGTRGRPGEHVL